MPDVLLIGIKSEAVDFSDPGMPPDLNAEKIAAGIEATLRDMRERGWNAGFCAILTDGSVEATIADVLKRRWDCVVIGGGIRMPASNLLLFERVVNAVRRGAPGTPIAFNTQPGNSADAAARWLHRQEG